MTLHGMRMRARLLFVTLLFALSACGGGGGGSGSNTPPPAPAPSGLSYSPAASTFVVGYSINPLAPTVSGTVSSYSVNPALPAGLSMNATTGAISGTPTAVTAAASYVVTATNSSGSATTNVAIGVTSGAPVVSYENSQLTLTTGVPVTLAPLNSGGVATLWTVTPALPDGLAFNATTGTITGVPSGTSNIAQYTVAAQNSGGVAFFNLNIRIDSGVLLDLGHAVEVKQIRHAGNRVLSLDTEGHWALWNATTAARVASGTLSCLSNSSCAAQIDLAGGVAALATGNTVELRSASNGQILSNATQASWWKLASDGSYLATGTAQALNVWSPTGTVLATKSGNYSQAKAHAAAAELRVANGPAGTNVIEKVTIATGVSANGPTFQGTFHSWFLDGERFFTNIGNTIWVYGQDSQQQDIRALPTIQNLTGQGQRFWTRDAAPVVVYTVGASGSPTATFTMPSTDTVIASGTTIGVLEYGTASLGVIDLAAATPTRIDVPLTVAYISTYAARSDAGWLVGNRRGVVVDATNSPASPTYFGFGHARGIVANSNRIAVSTMGGILFFNATTREQEGQINFSSSRLSLSSDGTVLAALANDEDAQYLTDRTIKIFALPSGTEIQSLPYSYPGPFPKDVVLSGSGQVLGKLVRTPSAGYFRETTTVGSGTMLWSDTLATSTDSIPDLTTYLSPTGNRIALPDGRHFSGGTTNLIMNGNLVGAAPGVPVGWLDEDQLLVNRYGLSTDPIVTWYATSDIVSPTGQLLRSVKLSSEIRSLQTVDANRIYSPQRNQIFSLTDGSTVWSSENPSREMGGVTATHIVFASGSTVRMEPY